MQPVVFGTSLRSFFTRSRVRLLVVALAGASVTSAVVLGCDDDTPSYPRGATPVVLEITSVIPNAGGAEAGAAGIVISPERDDAGEILGSAGAFSAAVTYALPAPEFIRDVQVQWAGLDTPTVFSYPAAATEVDGGPRVVTFEGEVPAILMANGAKLPFTVVLVSGRGEKSAPAGSLVTFTAKPQAR